MPTFPSSPSEGQEFTTGTLRFRYSVGRGWKAVLSDQALTVDGDILTRAAGVPARITRADLAADTARHERSTSLTHPVQQTSRGTKVQERG